MIAPALARVSGTTCSGETVDAADADGDGTEVAPPEPAAAEDEDGAANEGGAVDPVIMGAPEGASTGAPEWPKAGAAIEGVGVWSSAPIASGKDVGDPEGDRARGDAGVSVMRTFRRPAVGDGVAARAEESSTEPRSTATVVGPGVELSGPPAVVATVGAAVRARVPVATGAGVPSTRPSAEGGSVSVSGKRVSVGKDVAGSGELVETGGGVGGRGSGDVESVVNSTFGPGLSAAVGAGPVGAGVGMVGDGVPLP